METLHEQILETWNTHHRIMLMFLENLPDEGYRATLSKRGGRDVARQMAHVVNVRLFRLESFMKKQQRMMAAFDNDVSPSKDELISAFRESGELMAAYITHALENNGAVSNFRKGVVPMIGYYISHECHHRGHALLTLKQCGIKTSDALKWGIWDWNKL